MLTLPSAVRIHLCTRPVDMRKSFDGLSVLAREVPREEPLSGHLFVFFNRTRDMVRIPWWHS
jgi:transposase